MDQQMQCDRGSAVLSRPDCVTGPPDTVYKKPFPPTQMPLTSMLAGEFSKPAVIGHYRRLSATPETVKEILISVLESSGGLKYKPLPQMSPPRTMHSRTSCARDWTRSSDDDLSEGSWSESDDGYSEKENAALKKETTTQQTSSQLDPDEDCYYLPRSSPVISRKKRFAGPRLISSPGERSVSPSKQLSASPHRSPSPASVDSFLKDRKTCNPPLQEASCEPDKPRSTSLSANLNRLFPIGIQFPFKTSAFVEGARRSPEEGSKPRSHTDSFIHLASWKDAADVSKEPLNFASSPDDILKASSDLDKENAHFIIVDMVLSALESVKWAVQSHRAGEAAGGQPGSPSGLQDEEHNSSGSLSKKHSESVASSDSGYEGYPATQSEAFLYSPVSVPHVQKEPEDNAPYPNLSKFERNTLAPDLGTSSSLRSPSIAPTSPFTAEVLAQQLVTVFRKQWLHLERQPRSSSSPGPALQEFFQSEAGMPAECSVSLAEEIKLRSRMRGTLIWAPPRFQIIFNIHPPQKRSVVVASQHYLCAGCGTEVEPKYIKKLRYCEYLGKYFCDCCHSDSESSIPGHIVMKWDFSKYPVCNFSKQLLDSIWHNPLFNVSCINKALYSKAKELDRFRELQEQLLSIKKLLATCRLSKSVLQEIEQLPEHLTHEQHLFSLEDLVNIKRGLLQTQARALLKLASAHVEICELCLAKGFICEFCKSKEVLFPFQRETCKRCEECKACFHKYCFKEEDCPKCIRIQTRRKLKDSFSLDVK
ncbi:protein associated with UVRAG as autophagy enhancer isoform X2 [Amia ocellicauda]|uniref:protein associated with UVRAG as autophagy enhancer isoform X2 n=1 Tax=Amia ocellicauda TaxID=2972642 RepID=UPI003463FC57